MTAIAARPYAQALFELAREANQLDVVHDDIQSLGELTGQSDDFKSLVENPFISREKKTAVLDALLQGKSAELTLRFLRFLVSKNRLNLLEDVSEELHQMVLVERGAIEGEIRTAVGLSEDQVKEICLRLKAQFAKDILPTVKVDPELIGGFQVQIGDTVYDYSIKNQLENLRQRIISA